MKASELKKFIKQSVREAIHEELGSILKEAVKEQITPKSTNTSTPIVENMSFTTNDVHSQPQQPRKSGQELWGELMGETAAQGSPYSGQLQTSPSSDIINGDLPSGEVPFEMIMGAMMGGKK